MNVDNLCEATNYTGNDTYSMSVDREQKQSEGYAHDGIGYMYDVNPSSWIAIEIRGGHTRNQSPLVPGHSYKL